MQLEGSVHDPHLVTVLELASGGIESGESERTPRAREVRPHLDLHVFHPTVDRFWGTMSSVGSRDAPSSGLRGFAAQYRIPNWTSVGQFLRQTARVRADRLVATLLVLQTKGRVTAAELARELEVSERTARRDLEGLAMAGVPVYSQPGRGGGWELVGGARTDLSGLTADETRALFLVAGPGAATTEVRAALRKLVRALPATFRSQAQAAAGAVMHDAASWDHEEPAAPVHLEALQGAVIDGVQVELGYCRRDGQVSLRTVHPLGLVVKNGTWYLVAGTAAGQRTFRVSRVRSVSATDLPVERPEDFDLSEAWRSIVTGVDAQRTPITVTLRTDETTLDVLRWVFGNRVGTESPDTTGQIRVEVRAQSELMIARQLAGFADAVEVVSPKAVRDHLAEIGRGLVRRHTSRKAKGSGA
jgi:predicted DNA-binding transcriptional regulator YafY